MTEGRGRLQRWREKRDFELVEEDQREDFREVDEKHEF